MDAAEIAASQSARFVTMPVTSTAVLVIGGGQAGLAAAFHLQRQGLPFLIVDSAERVGDSWRHRWSSLKLFTPSAFNALPGAPWPRPAAYLPGKDEVADYLESYARDHELPIRLGTRVMSLRRHAGVFVAATPAGVIEAEQVIVATGPYVRPRVPAFASRLDSRILQLASTEYRRPQDLPPGPILVVGAGNSGAEIALELAATRPTILAGRDPGRVPMRLGLRSYRLLQAMTLDTAAGRALARFLEGRGHPVVRVSRRSLRRAGVERCGRVAEVRDGLPVVDDGRALEVEAVVWCTGFRPDFSWIDTWQPGDGVPRHERGVALDQPGLYFVGLPFQSSATSHLLGGVAVDAQRIVERLADRQASLERRPAQ